MHGIALCLTRSQEYSERFSVLDTTAFLYGHKAPVPEPVEEPLPGEHPIPQEDPIPSPNPEIDDPRP